MDDKDPTVNDFHILILLLIFKASIFKAIVYLTAWHRSPKGNLEYRLPKKNQADGKKSFVRTEMRQTLFRYFPDKCFQDDVSCKTTSPQESASCQRHDIGSEGWPTSHCVHKMVGKRDWRELSPSLVLFKSK